MKNIRMQFLFILDVLHLVAILKEMESVFIE
jgi:hypothetical protein